MQSVVIRRVLVQSLRNEGASVFVKTNLFRMRIREQHGRRSRILLNACKPAMMRVVSRTFRRL